MLIARNEQKGGKIRPGRSDLDADDEGSAARDTDAARVSAALRTVLDLSDMSAIPREKQPEASKPGGMRFFG